MRQTSTMMSGAVFGGGGIAGVAWEAGIVIGLQRAGVDLSSADLIVGTSAGSIVGSHVASGVGLQALAERPSASPGTNPPAAPAVDLDAILAALAPLFDSARIPSKPVAGSGPLPARRLSAAKRHRSRGSPPCSPPADAGRRAGCS
jgi:predicted acylesterase/phospholipase RssA